MDGENAVLDSSAVEAQPFEGKSEAELDALLDANEMETADQSQSPANQKGAAKGSPQQASGLSQEGTPAVGSSEEKYAALEKQLRNVQKELGQSRAVQQRMAQLEQLLQRGQQAQQRAEPKAGEKPLTAEQQAAEAYIAQRIDQYIKSQLGDLVDFGRAQMAAGVEMQANEKYLGGLNNLCNEFGVDLKGDMQPILKNIVDKVMEEVSGGIEGAQQKLDRILGPGGESYLFALGMKERNATLSNQAQTFAQTQTSKAQKASQTLKPVSTVGNQSKRKLDDYAGKESELGKMDEKEIDALLDEAGIR